MSPPFRSWQLTDRDRSIDALLIARCSFNTSLENRWRRTGGVRRIDHQSDDPANRTDTVGVCVMVHAPSRQIERRILDEKIRRNPFFEFKDGNSRGLSP